MTNLEQWANEELELLKGREIWRYPQFGIVLLRSFYDIFPWTEWTVVYGHQVDTGLKFQEAAQLLGMSIIHAINRAGLIDWEVKCEDDPAPKR